MISKMLLPLLGGAPAVWNTCMVFFQGMLLAGYAYAHYTAAWMGVRRQAFLHLVLLLAAAAFLPVSISASASELTPWESSPASWILVRLLITVGLPFFVISASGPLLQKWLSETGHTSGKDPYFLYATSNLGSLVALLSYPMFMEPHLRLREQSRGWTTGYGILVMLTLLCAVAVWRVKRAGARAAEPTGASLQDSLLQILPSSEAITLKRRLAWVALAFVPSSLMLGVTSYLSNDIAAIPLLWVVPLAFYLLTFILAFARRVYIRDRWVSSVLPLGALSLTYLWLSEATEPVWLLVLLHLFFFFAASLACHRRLANSRPPAEHLTDFYLCLSAGGVLGGIFNALIAPTIFNSVVEYPLAMILACVLGRESPKTVGSRQTRWLDLLLPVGIGVLSAVLALVLARYSSMPFQLRSGIVFGLPLIGVYALVDRPIRFALAIGALMLGSSLHSGQQGYTLHAERNFFGVSRVTLDPTRRFHRIVHGNTLHGQQFIERERRCEPLAYYHRTGPVGSIFNQFNATPASTNVAIVGLGAGSMASYSTANQHLTFYEIDPSVIRIANNSKYFSFLQDCTAAKVEIRTGDARLRMREASEAHYGLIVLDAFSSDAIPVHLLTREALQLYLAKLAEGGMLAFHISNRCLDLEPVLLDLARDASLISRVRDEGDIDATEKANGKEPSQWVIMVRRQAELGKLARDSRWVQLRGNPEGRVWTDDFSNLLSIFRWE